jgi:hypothetical protein
MKERRDKHITTRRLSYVMGVTLMIGLAAGPVARAEGIDPEADEILQSMSSYLGGLSAFSMVADIDNEIITLEGQKLQFSSFATLVIKRPAGFYVTRQGMFADVEFFFDGKMLTLHGKGQNIYAQVESPGGNDDAIRAVEFESGLDAPGADLLFADPYPILSSGVVSSSYLGTAYVNGVECHHLTFREDKVDWQLWVKVGDEPLPTKYVITSKWVTGAPQYEVRLRQWNTNPTINADQFKFSVPKGARKLESIPVNEMGEVTLHKEDES